MTIIILDVGNCSKKSDLSNSNDLKFCVNVMVSGIAIVARRLAELFVLW